MRNLAGRATQPAPAGRRSLEDPRLLIERRGRPAAAARSRRCSFKIMVLVVSVTILGANVMAFVQFTRGGLADSEVRRKAGSHAANVSSSTELSSPVTRDEAEGALATTLLSPPLILPHSPPPSPSSASSSANASPPAASAHTMAGSLYQQQPLSHKCLELVRGYWTFEVCLGEEVRQFHSYVKGVDRHQVTSLGKLAAPSPPSADNGADAPDDADIEDSRREAAAATAAAWIGVDAAGGDATPGLLQRYTGGDMCEAAQTRREAIVSVTCGASDRLVDAREPESCRYMLSVQLSSACAEIVATKETAAGTEAHEQANGAKLEASFDEEVKELDGAMHVADEPPRDKTEELREANEASARAAEAARAADEARANRGLMGTHLRTPS